MNFEFDESKSKLNKSKHGIDFKEAQKLWTTDVVEFPSAYEKEPRFFVVGRIGSKFWTAIITYRGEAVRIISVRKSRKTEVDFYGKT